MAEPAHKCPRCGTTTGLLTEGRLCPACLLSACLDSEHGESRPAGSEVDAAWLSQQGLETPATPAIPLRQFGDFELLEEIGRGAMGVVYRARQKSMDRVVAVKFLLAGPLASPEAVQRFEVEAAAAGILQHPGIVAIHETGTRDGQHYLVMDYVEGASLSAIVQGGPLAPRRAARLLKSIAEAVQFAHQHGVLHRDLKPSNVIVDSLEQPHVTDFGLAKRLGFDPGLTLSGDVMGSPNYLPPEQAGGSARQLGPHSDVYSLGAMLFHLLTGRPPFLAETSAEVLRQVLEQEPVRLRMINPSVPRDLETICLKCLEKQPSQRYESAQVLADDLERYLNGEPIQARPVGWLGRSWRWCRRKPVEASLIAGLAVAVALGFAGVFWQWRQARATAARETLERERAERTVYRMQIHKAEQLFADRQAAAGLAVLAALLRQHPSDRAVAEWIMSELMYRTWPLPVIEPLVHTDAAHYAEFSPDGKRVLTASLDNAAHLWDVATGKPIGQPLAHEPMAADYRKSFIGGLKCLYARFSPDGSKVATASVDHTARIWNGLTGEPITAPLLHGDLATWAQFSPDGALVATACKDGTIRLWNATTGQPVGPVLSHKSWVNFAEFSPDGQHLLTGADDGIGQIWEVATGDPVGSPLKHGASIKAAVFSPDGRNVATASSDSTARIWDAGTGEPLSIPLHHDSIVTAIQFSPDGGCLATASFDKTVRLWDVGTGNALGRPLDHQAIVRSVDFSPEGARLLTGAEDGTARLWDFRTGRLAAEPMRHAAALWSAHFSADGQRVVTASSDRTCRIWDVRPGAAIPVELEIGDLFGGVSWRADGRHLLVRSYTPRVFTHDPQGWTPSFDLHSDMQIGSAECRPDGKAIVTAAYDGYARICDPNSGEVLTRLFSAGGLSSAAYSPDGSRIVTSGVRSATVWNIDSGNKLLELEHPGSFLRSEFSPNGQRILSICDSNNVRVWDAQSGRLLAAWRPHSEEVTTIRFSPDSTRVLTSSRDSTARIWEADSGRLLTAPLRHDGAVLSACFSPDGARLLTASEDATARLWNVSEGYRHIGVLSHSSIVRGASFSANGKRIVTVSEDMTARLWDAATGQPLSSPLTHPGYMYSGEFSPDGSWIATVRPGELFIWPVPQADASWSATLAELAEAVAGVRLNPDLSFQALPPGKFLELCRQVQNVHHSKPGTEWLSWFLADRAKRPLAPGTQLTLEQAAALNTMSPPPRNKTASALLAQLRVLAHSNGVAYAKSALLSLKAYAARSDPRLLLEADWFARRATALATHEPCSWWARAAVLEKSESLAAAIPFLQHASQLPNPPAELLLAYAKKLEESGADTEALAAYDRAIQALGPDSPLGSGERRLALLTRSRLQSRLGNPAAARADRLLAYDFRLPPRDPDTPPNLLDLSDFFVASLDTDWRARGFKRHNLSSLPRGRQMFAGVEYDVRALLPLSSSMRELEHLHYPKSVRGVPVGGRYRRVHFLHAADCIWGGEGAPLGIYTMRWADGQEEKFPIRGGYEINPWDYNTPSDLPNARVAWRGVSPAGLPVLLYSTTWTNSRPDVPLATIDLESTAIVGAPLIVAITAE